MKKEKRSKKLYRVDIYSTEVNSDYLFEVKYVVATTALDAVSKIKLEKFCFVDSIEKLHTINVL